MKTSEKARQRNKRVKSVFRGKIKEFQSDKEKSPASLNQVVKILDKAAARNVIHKNKAARLKSRLAKMAAKKA